LSIDLLGTLSIILGALVQDSITCVVAGVLVSQGKISWATASIGCFVGVLVGDLFWVSIGRLFSLKVIEGWLGERVAPGESVSTWIDWFRKNRIAAVFISRFTPGLQIPLHLLNGLVSGGVRRLLPAYIGATLVYVAILLPLAWWMTDSAESWLHSRSSSWLLFAAGIFVWGLFHLAGRLLYFALRRFIRSESTSSAP
jgi:membrane protein DedA with SNARE-associated domain